MSQNDMTLANAGGAAFRADANSALAALVSLSSGATAPSTMFAYMFWADTTTGLLKIRNAANSAWVTVGTLATAGLGLPTLTAANIFTADQTITSTSAGATGPALDLYHNSATPAASDLIGMVMFNGEDSAGNKQEYERIYGAIADPTSGSEDGYMGFMTLVAGTLANRLFLSQGLYTAGAAGGDMGANTINATTLYQGGVAVSTSSGKIAQIVEGTTSADFSITATIPIDATIPQISEGTEIVTRAVTPTNASSTFLIEAEVQCAHSTVAAPIVLALFTDANANAVAVIEGSTDNTSITQSLVFSHILPAFGDVSAHTVRLRGGVASGTLYVNRHLTIANLFDTAMITRLRVTEILP